MKLLIRLIIVFSSPFLLLKCTHSKGGASKPKSPEVQTQFALPPGFNEYWYQGKAEISVYDVTQERYGELRTAQQVNVFVTEDFSRQKQVKLDDPANAGNDRVPILKLNTLRRFHTGIYDYSLEESIFTPVDGSATLKTTATIQDWCGHVFTQINLDKNQYRLREYSYFESEGDQDKQLPVSMLEDEIWARIRLNPAGIDTGEINIIPASFFCRLRHKPFKVEPARLAQTQSGNESVLTLSYHNIPRILHIRYETVFPHHILGWEETDNGTLSSKGTFKYRVMSPYWEKHGHDSDGLRDSLKLQF